MKNKYLYTLIFYFIVSNLTCVFIASNYLIDLVYIIVNGVISFIVFKVINDINEKYLYKKYSSLFRLTYFEELSQNHNINSAILKANSKMEIDKLKLDYMQIVNDKTLLSKYTKSYTSKAMELTLLEGVKTSLKDVIRIEKEEYEKIEKEDYLNKYNKILLDSGILIGIVLLVRILFGNQIIKYTSYIFILMYMITSLFPLILGLIFFNLKRKDTYEI